ncbi:MAG: hypothetical protein JNM64_12210, partial [Chloroflexia bacterium]|nr:hypothetical protein [Chloroflexia bacterium]
MDSTRFDRIAAALTGETGRRDTLRLLGASLLGVGGLAVLGVAEGDARKKHKKNKKKKKNSCKGRCGGKCPRCGLGTTCSTRDECTTALCDGGVCTKPDNAADCGTDTDGNMCATREISGVNSCTRIAGRFLAGG